MPSLGEGRQEWLLPVLQIIPGVQMKAARLCLLRALTVTACRYLMNWTRLAGR